jgi:hypothetical protein
MGNASSSGGRGHHDESVDYGALVPQGIYTGPRDWNHAIVSQLIVARKLAPFYRPLEDYDASWDDDQILAARKQLSPDADTVDQPTRSESMHSISPKSSHSRRSASNRELPRADAAVYRGAVECPICFLVSFLSVSLLRALASHYVMSTELSPQYQPFSMLRPGNMHRVLCSDQTQRTHDYTSRFRANRMPLLRPRQLWRRLSSSSLASGHG